MLIIFLNKFVLVFCRVGVWLFGCFFSPVEKKKCMIAIGTSFLLALGAFQFVTQA